MTGQPMRSVVIMLSTLALLSLVAVSCQIVFPALNPSYVEAIYYRGYQEPIMGGKTTYGYIQLYDQGVFTFVDITPEQPTPMTVVETYDQIAVTWLVPNGVPSHTGNYVILGNRITLNYPAMGANGSIPAKQSMGRFSVTTLELSSEGDTTVEYLRYPPGNDAPLLNNTSQISSGSSHISCLLGPWRVDPDSYVTWMNAVENKDPNILFTQIAPAFHFQFDEQGNVSLYLDPNNYMTFVSNDPDGGNAEILMELDYSSGALKGTFSGLKADPDYPDLMLMTMNISENPITVIGMKVNGQSIPQVENLDVIPVIEPTYFNKVGYVCSDDTLQLIPLGTGLPVQGYLLYRDKSWQPSVP
jgi:hypothetical protein